MARPDPEPIRISKPPRPLRGLFRRGTNGWGEGKSLSNNYGTREKCMSQNPTGFCPRTTRPFCFGKRTKNHFHLGVVFQIPCDSRKLRRLRNSLRSNSPRRISEVGCAPRPRQRRVYLLVRMRRPKKTEKKKSLPI